MGGQLIEDHTLACLDVVDLAETATITLRMAPSRRLRVVFSFAPAAAWCTF